ncbi:MAG TPA: sigma factor-like helix-turn-helix DNA-binding protein, partial [Sedimentisphaerales bacterium]|nr:sigma factor-like helix-turn-helix DNA-binding protein [Sedimentisphaerales bacterium]
ISSDTIIVGLLSPNRKLFSDNNLQFYEKESTSVQITQILRKLKPAPIVLKYLQGLETQEACELLGLTVNAMQVRLNRARAKLKEQLGDLFEEML